MRHSNGMDNSALDYDILMERYVDVCNQALALNCDRFPFKQILGAAKASECGKVIEVHVVDEAEQAVYAMAFGQNGLSAMRHADCKDCICDREWDVRTDYLTDVAKNPDLYIQNPAKIDWDWMYDSPAS